MLNAKLPKESIPRGRSELRSLKLSGIYNKGKGKLRDSDLAVASEQQDH